MKEEEGNKGVQFFKEFFKWILKEYDLISKHLDRFYSSKRTDLELESMENCYLSLLELKRYIRESYIFDLISTMFRQIDKDISEML